MSNAKRSLAHRQKMTVIFAIAAIVLLAVAFFAVRYLVSIYDFTDTDGTPYFIKPEGGSYALFDENGYMLDTTIEDGKEYFVTDIGTMVAVSIDGKATIYAAVDTDEGEDISEYKRLLIFPKIESSKQQSLRIENTHGSYTFKRDSSGQMTLRGYENVTHDSEAFAYLSALCGSLVAMEKYDSKVLEKYGLAEYGLDEPQAKYTVSGGNKSYTMLVGDPIVSGNGYYVMLEGRQTVYIINSYYGMLLDPVESYIKPLMAYGLNTNNYPEVQNFRYVRYDYGEDGKPIADPVTALTYWDYAERENTEYQTQSYKMLDEDMGEYTPNSDAVTTTMNSFATMEHASVVKLGASEKVRAEYGLDKPRSLITYDFVLTDASTLAKTYLRYYYWFSDMTERGTYYAVADMQVSEDGETYIDSLMFDYILELDRAMAPFLEWNKIDFVEKYYFHRNIMIIDEMEFSTPDYHISFKLTAGKDDIERIAATMNGETREIDIKQFKVLYRNMLFDVLYDETGKSDAEQKAIVADHSRHQFTYRVKTSLNKLDTTYSFYHLAEARSYITIEGGGDFFVMSSAVKKNAEDVLKLWNGETLVSIAQN